MLPEISEMLQETYGSPHGKAKVDWWTELPDHMVKVSVGDLNTAFTKRMLDDIQQQVMNTCGIPQEALDEYSKDSYQRSRSHRTTITPSHHLNPLLLLCN